MHTFASSRYTFSKFFCVLVFIQRVEGYSPTTSHNATCLLSFNQTLRSRFFITMMLLRIVFAWLCKLLLLAAAQNETPEINYSE